jgi:hypothetical protein
MTPCADGPGAKFGHPMPTALLIAAAFAVCVVLPGSASAKQLRSASVKREFQLTHPCSATGRTSGACPGYVKDRILPLACGDSDAVSNLQRQTIRDAKAKDIGKKSDARPVRHELRSLCPQNAEVISIEAAQDDFSLGPHD